MTWATLACKTLECMERCFEGLGGLTISPALCSMKARDKNQGARWLSQTYDGLLLLKKKEEEEVQDDIFLLHTFLKLCWFVDFWSVVFHFGLAVSLLCAGYKLCVPNIFHTFSTCKPLWNHGNALMYGRGYGGIVLWILLLIQIAFGFSFRANNSWTRWKGKLF